MKRGGAPELPPSLRRPSVIMGAEVRVATARAKKSAQARPGRRPNAAKKKGKVVE